MTKKLHALATQIGNIVAEETWETMTPPEKKNLCLVAYRTAFLCTPDLKDDRITEDFFVAICVAAKIDDLDEKPIASKTKK